MLHSVCKDTSKTDIREERDMKVIIINGPNLNLLGVR